MSHHQSEAPWVLQAVFVALLLAAIGYVAVRVVLAHRRGDGVGKTTGGALRAVVPPLALVLVALVALMGIVTLGIVAFAFENGAVAWVLALGLASATFVGAVAWAVVRVLRSRR